MAEKVNIRELALDVLLLVERENYKLNDALHAQLLKYQYMNKQDRAFLSRLCEGVMEYRIRLDYLLDSFSKTPVAKCKALIRCLLRLGAYQILFLDSVPDSAACNECVKLAKKRGFGRLAGFVNGILRNLSRQKEALSYPDREKYPLTWLSVFYSLPEWLVKQWYEQYGWERTEKMAKASVEPAALTIRYNESRCSLAECELALQQEGIKTMPILVNEEMRALLPEWIIERMEAIACRLENVDYLARYGSFQKGLFTVQDVSSMLPGILACEILKTKMLQYEAEDRDENTDILVLDMCAAPGGKTTHIASWLQGRGQVIARDVTKAKVERLKENLNRLLLSNVIVEVQDAREYTKELTAAADVVILDAPCSGLGVLGRKKDICYSMSLEQERELQQLQRQMLTVAADYVKPGGTLLYSTCTVNVGENSENANWFLGEQSTFRRIQQFQLLPGVMPVDGFFIVQMERQKE